MLRVDRAARCSLKERGCFKNIDRNGDRRFDKLFLSFATLARHSISGLRTCEFFVDNLVLLGQSLTASSSHWWLIYVLDRYDGNIKVGPAQLSLRVLLDLWRLSQNQTQN